MVLLQCRKAAWPIQDGNAHESIALVPNRHGIEVRHPKIHGHLKKIHEAHQKPRRPYSLAKHQTTIRFFSAQPSDESELGQVAGRWLEYLEFPLHRGPHQHTAARLRTAGLLPGAQGANTATCQSWALRDSRGTVGRWQVVRLFFLWVWCIYIYIYIYIYIFIYNF